MLTKKSILKLLQKLLPAPLVALSGENTSDSALYAVVYALVILGLSVLLFFASGCTITLSVQKNTTNSSQSSETSQSTSVDSTTIFQPQTLY